MDYQPRLLVVDDEETLREGLKIYLEHEGYLVDTADGAEDAMTFEISRYDLLLLDIMMGEISGFDFAIQLKANPLTSEIPIIFLTAKSQTEDMVKGLKIGADDYIVKPFSVKNVLARIEAILRRSKKGMPKVTAGVNSDGVICDRISLICKVDGEIINFPKKEFEILSLLLENKGRIYTREELMQKIWPENVVVADRSIDVHITRIRNKIGSYGKNIISRSGYGYGWQD